MSLSSSHPAGQVYGQLYSRYSTSGDIYRSALASYTGNGPIICSTMDWPSGGIGGGNAYSAMTTLSALNSRPGSRIAMPTPVDGSHQYDQSQVDSLPRPSPEVQQLFQQQHYNELLPMTQPMTLAPTKTDSDAGNQRQLFCNDSTGYPVCTPTPAAVEPSHAVQRHATPPQDDSMMTSSAERINCDLIATQAAETTSKMASQYAVRSETQRLEKSGSSSISSQASTSSSDGWTTLTIDAMEQPDSKAVSDELGGGHVLAPHHCTSGGDVTSERHCLLWACKTCKKKTTAAVDRRKVSNCSCASGQSR